VCEALLTGARCSHVDEANGALAFRARSCLPQNEANVVGFDTLNEPNGGFIGRKDLASRSDGLAFRWGLNLSPFELMTVAAGFGECNSKRARKRERERARGSLVPLM